MNKKKYYSYICIIFLSIVSISFIWEFWLETLVLGFFYEGFEPESLAERWEYIITIAFFVCLSLIYPVVMGGKFIVKQNWHYDEFKRLSERDQLTGCYNRRKIKEDLLREVSRSKRYGHIFSAIMLDIDCFKEINDEFGHNVGDRVLVEISEVIRNTVRACDIVGRWGGDEFVVLCPETNRDGTYFLADKLRKRIEGNKFGIVGDKTVSVGVAEYEAEDNIDGFMNKADKALYLAKRQGKNRVVRAA
jgi:diguanylate cyclase (GGDEF)-like protein